MRLLAAIVALCSLSACARTLPAKPAAAALYRDLQRLVSLAGTAGWSNDRREVEELLPAALASVCRSTPADRRALRLWLAHRTEALGGPLELAYRRAGKDLGGLTELLETTRVRRLMEHAARRSGEDCPFWLEPEPRFAGRQISDDRWLLSAGGGGKAIFSRRAGENDVSFGGAGRLLVGRSFGSRLALYSGIELGGSATFPTDNGATPQSGRGSLVLGLDLVVPVVARIRLVNFYVELEAGYLAHFTEETEGGQSGLHFGLSGGFRASRKRWFFPGAAFGVFYEQAFGSGDDRRIHLLKLGFRVVFDVDL